MSNKKQALMKNLALVFTAVLLIGATVSAKTTTALEDNSSATNFKRGYSNSFIFTEGGIEFSVFPDGQFDFYAPNYGPDVNVAINSPNVSFSFNRGYDYSPYIQYDDFGAIVQIENVPIYYDYYGRVIQVGNVDINYNNYGRVARVGGLYVHYNRHRAFTHYTGYINVYNQVYVYRPWHVYYAIPAPSYCIVYAQPYRQYYTPIRYDYYSPYTNNYRQPVHYDYRRVTNNANGRRGDLAATNRSISDRYRPDASTTRNGSTIGRTNARGTESINSGTRAVSRNDNMVRTSSLTRSNQTERTTNDQAIRTTDNRNITRTTTPSMETRVDRTNASDRNVRSSVQRNDSPIRNPQANQRQEVNRNTSAVTKSTQRVNTLPNRKPQPSNTRISNNEQQQRSTFQRDNSQKSESVSRQPNSRSASKRGAI